MKKSLKISLGIVVLTFLSMILGITNVKAAEPIIFQTILSVEMSELDLGTLVYDTSKWQSFRIKNTTSEVIEITDVRIDTPNFEFEIMPESVIQPNATTLIQIKNIRGIDVADSPVTGNLIVTVNNTTEVTLPLKVSFEKGAHENPSYAKERAIDDPLSVITLTNGWTWVNPDTLILEGVNKYKISYTDTTGNYKDEIREIEVTGLKAYTVKLPSDRNTWAAPQSDYRLLEGYSSNLTINASAGYLLTSITINGVEQITNKTKKFEYNITDIRENIVIETKTERIVYDLMKDSSTNSIIVPKYIFGTEGNIQLKFDYDFDKFYNSTYDVYNISDIIINGEFLKFEDILKYFKFHEGSVIVEISNEYLNTLGVGVHDFELDLATNELFKGTFIIEEKAIENPVINNPNTNDNILTYLVMMIVSFGSILVINKFKNKKI